MDQDPSENVQMLTRTKFPTQLEMIDCLGYSISSACNECIHVTACPLIVLSNLQCLEQPIELHMHVRINVILSK